MKIESIIKEYYKNNTEDSSEEEEKIIREIRRKEIKLKVSTEKYYEITDGVNCYYCMNYDEENDKCNKNNPRVNPFYTKDNNLDDSCDDFDYVYMEDIENK